MRMTLNGLAVLALLVVGSLGAACQDERTDTTGKNVGPLGDGMCKTRDEIPPPVINAPNGGACPAVGSDCSHDGLPISFCNDGERRMVLTCDAATKTWQVEFRECPGDGGITISDADTNVEVGPPPANTPASATCKPRDEVPPPQPPGFGHGVESDGVTCVPEGTACDFRFSLCTDKEGHNVYMECDNTKHTWYIVYKSCT
ncbi:MAG: hypothetical protein QOI66_5523 [Myxococcales bacterium]|nr:hypothetical protein [Myxococcales bacterium]